MQNKALLDKVACIALDGLDIAEFTRLGPVHCPFLWSMRRVITKAPGKNNRIEDPLNALLFRPLTSKKAKALGLVSASAGIGATLALLNGKTAAKESSNDDSDNDDNHEESDKLTDKLFAVAQQMVLTRSQLISVRRDNLSCFRSSDRCTARLSVAIDR